MSWKGHMRDRSRYILYVYVYICVMTAIDVIWISKHLTARELPFLRPSPLPPTLEEITGDHETWLSVSVIWR